jgi:CO/xanthine dehydrogenase Mo-binding subunit
MVNVITLRSPVARGSVHSVSLPSLPSGYRAIFPHDIPGKNRLASFHPDIPILAWDELSYRGQPVALIAGPDPIVLESLAANTKIDCAEEEGYLDWESFSSKQVVAKRVVTIGDPDLAFSIAPDVQDATYYTGAVYHYYSEPQGAVAAYDYDKIAIWCATQWPYHVRDSVALALGCRAEEVSVRPSRLGVHLDGKLWYPSLLACHAAVAAVACGRPAKILLTREEDFLYAPKRAQSSISIRSALGPDKELSAMDIRIAIDVGAHPALAEDILNNAILSSTGAYRCPNLRVEGYAVSTNVPPLGPFGGFGSAHTLYAIETHTNNLASLVQEDPADWKSRNILRKGSSLITGEKFKDSIPYPLILERLSASSDYRRKHASYELIRKRRSKKTEGPLRGIGLAFACQGTGSFVSEENANSYSVEVELDKDLKVVIKTSAAAGSGGVLDIWRRTAADSLNIPLANVRVAPADTDESPNSGPATLSSGITIVNRLVEKACLTIQKRRFRDPLPLSAHSSYRIPKSIHWEEGSVASSSFDSAAWAGAVVELELDPWTLESRPSRHLALCRRRTDRLPGTCGIDTAFALHRCPRYLHVRTLPARTRRYSGVFPPISCASRLSAAYQCRFSSAFAKSSGQRNRRTALRRHSRRVHNGALAGRGSSVHTTSGRGR